MSWIREITLEEATGFLKKQLEAAVERAGRVWNIVQVMSLNPRSMDSSLKLYGAVMFGESPLSRSQREMLATVVSKVQGCVY